MSTPLAEASTSCSATTSASISRSTSRMRRGIVRRSRPIARCTLYDASLSDGNVWLLDGAYATTALSVAAPQPALAEVGEREQEQHRTGDEPPVHGGGILERGGELVAEHGRREHARKHSQHGAEHEMPQPDPQRSHDHVHHGKGRDGNEANDGDRQEPAALHDVR